MDDQALFYEAAEILRFSADQRKAGWPESFQLKDLAKLAAPDSSRRQQAFVNRIVDAFELGRIKTSGTRKLKNYLQMHFATDLTLPKGFEVPKTSTITSDGLDPSFVEVHVFSRADIRSWSFEYAVDLGPFLVAWCKSAILSTESANPKIVGSLRILVALLSRYGFAYSHLQGGQHNDVYTKLQKLAESAGCPIDLKTIKRHLRECAEVIPADAPAPKLQPRGRKPRNGK